MARKSFIFDEKPDHVKKVIDMTPVEKDGKTIYRAVGTGSFLTGAVKSSPFQVPVPIIDGVIGLLDNIVTTIRDISVEKQKTIQARAQAEAMIEDYREQTKRTQIEQMEQTERSMIQYQTRLAELAAEMQQNKMKVEKDLTILRETNQWGTQQLQKIHDIVDHCTDALRELNHEFLQEKNPELRGQLHLRMQSLESQLQHCVSEIASSVKPQ